MRVAMIEAAEKDDTLTTSAHRTHLPDIPGSTFTATVTGPQTVNSQTSPSSSASHVDARPVTTSSSASPEALSRDEPETWNPQISQRRSREI